MNINIDSLRKKASDIVKKHQLPGMGLGVVSSKEVIFAEGFGYSEIEAKTNEKVSLLAI